MTATILICIAIAVIIILGVRSYMKRVSSGCCGSGGGGTVKKIRVPDKDKSHYPYRKVLWIDGMVCGNCAANVENALNSLDGVWAKVNLTEKKAEVLMKKPFDDEILKLSVKDSGYTVFRIDES
ncbi:heavy-metal-associated domain-containing protein [Eubacterium limosum]|uniref:Heavy metal-associated domain-containing protein n=1 Tax=Eubacterium limosum TaxID=1736 RepID=A0ABT5UTI5_EUBLI|nr:heavy metal-associated domain-containing protein [Eubacterium limosum]MCB6571966.1 heavy-metal-associated domain-containing protein [Eubacterium limosum]MDE1472196.1 heavy metal-associated domain-containing protein [Eubacterium limosum]